MLPWGGVGCCLSAAALYLLGRSSGRDADALRSVARVNQLKDLAQLLDTACKVLPLVVTISGRVGSETPIKCERSGLRGVIVEETAEQHFLKHNDAGSWIQDSALMLSMSKEVPWYLKAIACKEVTGHEQGARRLIFSHRRGTLLPWGFPLRCFPQSGAVVLWCQRTSPLEGADERSQHILLEDSSGVDMLQAEDDIHAPVKALTVVEVGRWRSPREGRGQRVDDNGKEDNRRAFQGFGVQGWDRQQMFRFEKHWLREGDFMEVVKSAWDNFSQRGSGGLEQEVLDHLFVACTYARGIWDDGTGRVYVLGARAATGLVLTVASELFEESGRSLVRGTLDYLQGLKMLGVKRVERVLPMGTSLTVVGEAVKDDVGTIRIQQPHKGPFFVSPKNIDQLIANLGKWARWYKCASLGFTVFGIYLLAKHTVQCLLERRRRWELQKRVLAAAAQRQEQDNEGSDGKLEKGSENGRRDRVMPDLCVICLEQEYNAVFVPGVLFDLFIMVIDCKVRSHVLLYTVLLALTQLSTVPETNRAGGEDIPSLKLLECLEAVPLVIEAVRVSGSSATSRASEKLFPMLSPFKSILAFDSFLFLVKFYCVLETGI
ncbi:hypothetical protein Taro_004748 [Colocasia esculenta]|uniref:RING-type E3 ubiquitin transferase n=1 Tax=Colocasia esculenta TaxID=4460 RepID=A0A843TN14_COLES|nr:hypothetical protein [Colocasia esculenta]